MSDEYAPRNKIVDQLPTITVRTSVDILCPECHDIASSVV